MAHGVVLGVRASARRQAVGSLRWKCAAGRAFGRRSATPGCDCRNASACCQATWSRCRGGSSVTRASRRRRPVSRICCWRGSGSIRRSCGPGCGERGLQGQDVP